MPGQARFDKVNPVGNPHALADNEVATATNVDFALGGGAVIPRRGCLVFSTLSPGQPVRRIFRNYNNPAVSSNLFYGLTQDGIIWRFLGNTVTQLASGGNTLIMGAGSFQQYALLGGGLKPIKDDGVSTTLWVKDSPPAPTVTVNTLAPLLFANQAFSVTEGTAVSVGLNTATFVTDGQNRAQVVILFNPAPLDLDHNGANQIGHAGIHFVDIGFSNPSLVTRVSQDYAVGDSSFANYWHTELSPTNAIVQPAQADPNTLIDAAAPLLGSGTSTNPLTANQRAQMIANIRDNNQPSLSGFNRIQNTPGPWGVARPEFGMIGTFGGTNPWQRVYAVQFTIECTGTCTVTMSNPAIYGALNFPLNDVNVGYYWWQTYATLDANGNKVDEGAPSPPAGPFQVQQANATVVGKEPSGLSPGHGVTHIITYRQGGYSRDAYAVNTQTTTIITSATFTDTMEDIVSIGSNNVMLRNILSRTAFPTNVISIADVFNSRVYIAEQNNLHWSLPGQPGAFPLTSITQVSNIGDNIKGLVSWPPGLVIVNQNSVFEITGNNWENGDFILSRSGCRKGGIAPNTIIKTPYGVPLLSWDGLSMYVPGSGVDQEILWLNEEYGDMFRGASPNDPAALKGNRIPALAQGSINDSSAAYGQGRLYLAATTGSDTQPFTLFVIDFSMKRVFWYRYNFAIYSLFWDSEQNRLMAGTADGRVMQLETGRFDSNTDGSTANITWSIITKSWSLPINTVVESVYAEVQGSHSVQLQGDANIPFGGVNSVNASTRAWRNIPIGGNMINNFQASITGTQSSNGPQSAIYQLMFDTIPDPAICSYYRTPQDNKGHEADKLWDVAYYDLDIVFGTVTAVTFIDNVVVLTTTLTQSNPGTLPDIGAFSGGRVTYMQAFPAETYGRVAVTTYTSSWPTQFFKHFTTQYDARPEPPKVTIWRTDIRSLDENICDTFDVDINASSGSLKQLGTVTATVFIDNTAIQTSTITGTDRQSYAFSLPDEQYGRTLYVRYTGVAPFKHYNTWFHLRPEPDRVADYVSDKVSAPEHEWKVFTPEIACLGNTVLATAFVDNTAIGTYTLTGSLRQSFTRSLPIRTFGRTTHAIYHAVTGVFKHYYPHGLNPMTRDIAFEGDPEPSRVTLYRTGPFPFPASNYLKTWQPLLDPITGTVTGTLIVDDQVLNISTFTGDRRQWFTVGLDINPINAIETGSRWEAVYSSTQNFKHYMTKMETETKPFGKNVWAYSYRKLGGASQVDLARFFSIEIEADGPTTVEYFWDVNGIPWTSGNISLTGGIQWFDRVALPPGMRGYLFLFRLQAFGSNVKVYKVNLDLAQEGVKGLVRREVEGTPPEPQRRGT